MSDITELHLKIDRIEKKQDKVLEKLDEKLDETNRILDRLTVSVEVHEKRTTANEVRITSLEDDNVKRKAINSVWLKVGALIVGISTVIGAIVEVINKLH